MAVPGPISFEDLRRLPPVEHLEEAVLRLAPTTSADLLWLGDLDSLGVEEILTVRSRIQLVVVVEQVALVATLFPPLSQVREVSEQPLPS